MNTIKLIVDPKMMKFNLLIIFSGVSIAYWSGIISPIVVYQLENDPDYMHLDLEENEKDQKALFTMIWFGFGEVIGGFFMGWFIDKFSAKKATIVNMLIALVTIIVTLISISIARFNFVSFFMAFLWGALDGVINIQI